MRKLTNSQRRKELKAIRAMPDQRIDLTDIPELTEVQLGRAIRGLMYRPVKKPVTMRLDADVIAWLKQNGRGYQTKANALLRKEMLRACQQEKGPEREGSSMVRNSRSKRARSR